MLNAATGVDNSRYLMFEHTINVQYASITATRLWRTAILVARKHDRSEGDVYGRDDFIES
jgi:hypothetical protein